MDKTSEIEGRLAQALVEHLEYGLESRHGVVGLRWSDDMPEDDPHAELLVVDEAGQEYVLDVDVTLYPRRAKG